MPAGGRLTLDADDYGGPWFEIFGEADVSRVSVTINFVDDAGRGVSARQWPTIAIAVDSLGETLRRHGDD